MRCIICGEEFEGKVFGRVWNQPHNQNVHPDYSAWYKRWAEKVMVSAVLSIGILIPADYLSLKIGNTYLLIAINALLIAWMIIWVIQLPRTTTKLRIKWQKAHGNC